MERWGLALRPASTPDAASQAFISASLAKHWMAEPTTAQASAPSQLPSSRVMVVPPKVASVWSSAVEAEAVTAGRAATAASKVAMASSPPPPVRSTSSRSRSQRIKVV